MDQEFLLEMIETSTNLPTEFLRLLKLNLEMEAFAPKLEAISQDQPFEQCSESKSFIEYQSGVFACSLDELEGKDLSGVSKSSFDYLIQNNEQNNFIRIYTIAGSVTFNEIFNELSDKGVNIAVQLIVKPKKCPFYHDEVLPTGYGLEFELKSSQYVVEEPQEEIPDEEEVKVSKENVLKAFKDIKEVPQFQGKAISSLTEENVKFEDILKVSTNIPLISDQLKNLKASKTNLKESVFRINDFELKSANADPFRLLDFMNIYSKITNELRILAGKSSLRKILRSRIGGNIRGSTIRYDIRSEAITFLNDLEKDKRYSKWPKSIDESELEDGEFYAKNILTVVIPIDFESQETSSLLENLVQMVSYGYPMRFAVLPIVSESQANIKPWIKTYYAIKQSYGLRASVSFLRNAVQMYQSDPENSKDLITFLLSQLNLEINQDDGEELTKEAEITCKKFKITSDSSEVFMNGLPIPITQNLPQILMDHYVEELEFIRKDESLMNSEDLYESILEAYEAKNERLTIEDGIRYHNDRLLPVESVKELLGIQRYFESEPKK